MRRAVRCRWVGFRKELALTCMGLVFESWAYRIRMWVGAVFGEM
jgi:hypothetical protein